MSDRVTLRTIAGKAGLSVATTCLALSRHKRVSKSTQDRVHAISRELGYGKASNGGASGSERRTYGIVILGPGQALKYGSSIITSLSHAAESLDSRLEMLVIPDLEDREKLKSRLSSCAKELSGLFITDLVDVETVDFLGSLGIPCVILGDIMDYGELCMGAGSAVGTKIGQVTHDTVGMGWMATKHLLNKGLSPVAFIAYQGCRGLYQDRWLVGYRNALLDAGIGIDDRMIHLEKTGNPALETLARRLLKLNPSPCGYVIPDPELALTFVHAMEMVKQRIPNDSMVLGGTRYRVKQCGLDRFASIEPDIETWARSALAHMEMLAKGYICWRENVSCPSIFHMPAPG